MLHVRTHADVTDPEFTGLKALLEVKEKVRGWTDVQIVAFPQEGMLSFPRGVGADGRGAEARRGRRRGHTRTTSTPGRWARSP